jgi:hypothetical protein
MKAMHMSPEGRYVDTMAFLTALSNAVEGAEENTVTTVEAIVAYVFAGHCGDDESSAKQALHAMQETSDKLMSMGFELVSLQSRALVLACAGPHAKRTTQQELDHIRDEFQRKGPAGSQLHFKIGPVTRSNGRLLTGTPLVPSFEDSQQMDQTEVTR